MVSIILSIMSLMISMLTLLFYLFQEYKEFFTLYWLSEYEVICIPRSYEGMESPDEFVERYNREFKKNLIVCQFKKQWIGKISQTYYSLTYSEYMYPKDETIFKIFSHPEYYDYFSRCIVTHKGNIMKKRKLKEESI